MDIQFYFVQYQILQGHYNVFCKPGATNLSNCFTKHNPPHHHRRMHPVYLHCPGNANNASVRVLNSSQNTILKEIPKQDSNEETHLQIRIIEIHRQAYEHTGGGN